MPLDPLGMVTVVPKGVDPERRPTAPPPKRGSGASYGPARPPKPSLRPTPEAATRTAEIRAKVPPARTQADIERDRRIRELRDKARGKGTREERADAAYKARLAEREAQQSAPTAVDTPATAQVAPKSNGAPDEREAWRQRLSVAMKASWEKRRRAKATLGEKLLQKVETVKAELAETLLSPSTAAQAAIEEERAIAARAAAAVDHEAEFDADWRADEARDRLRALAAAAPFADPALAAAFNADEPPGTCVVEVLERPAAVSIPEGAHVVIERLDREAGEVALELDFEEAFGFRVARSHEGGDPDAPAVATILCRGKLQAEPVGIVDPTRARAIAARLTAAADLAEALLRTPDDQLAAFVLRGMEA